MAPFRIATDAIVGVVALGTILSPDPHLHAPDGSFSSTYAGGTAVANGSNTRIDFGSAPFAASIQNVLADASYQIGVGRFAPVAAEMLRPPPAPARVTAPRPHLRAVSNPRGPVTPRRLERRRQRSQGFA